MLVDFSNDLEKKVEVLSNLMNLQKEELVKRAVKVFIDDTEKMVQLRNELLNWDKLSDESLLNIENSI